MSDQWTAPFNADNVPSDPTRSHSFRPYRLAHQTLCITHIDFEQRLLIGFTQLIIWPLTGCDLRKFHLNCRQCRIHRVLMEAADVRTDLSEEQTSNTINSSNRTGSVIGRLPPPTDLPVIYNDPSVEICKRDTKLRTLDSFQRCHTSVFELTDADKGAGEITIRPPVNFRPLLLNQQALKLTVEFSLHKPKAGFYFVLPPGDGSLAERGVHAFTSTTSNSSRLWFPCIDCSEACTWKIEVTVPEDMVAIAPGELLDAPYYTEDLTHKTYHFYLGQPVAAPHIGISIGAFEIYPDPVLTTATHFCPSGLLSLMKHTVSQVPDMIEYYEAILASQYPFSTIKTVFVDRAYSDFQAYASLLIFPVDLLHSTEIIDQAIETRKIISLALAYQFFGCFITMQTWCDAWLPIGIAGYLSGLYQKRVFGNNEYRHSVSKEMRHVTDFEHSKYGILLDPSKATSKNTHFSLTSPHTVSPNYMTAYVKKSHLVIRILELRIGQPVLLQVLNKLLVLARLSANSILQSDARENTRPTQTSNTLENTVCSPNAELPINSTLSKAAAVPPRLTDENQANLNLSTVSFRHIISMVTGQDIQNFLEQWVYRSGHVRLFAKFHFNRKRNIVELELKQDLQSRGALSYTGPLTVMLQELDGAFKHTFKMEEGRTSLDLPCHSKSRKHRKKKIPLSNGDEIDMDLGRIDAESPLLWVRLDPDLAVVRNIRTDQPDYMWHLMLAHDRDCLGQSEALQALRDFPSPETRHTLSSIISNERVFYRVRIDACFTLCHVVNEPSSVSNAATSCLMPTFWQLFSSPAARCFVRQNNFTNLQHYFLGRAMIRALSTLRVQQVCPREVLTFVSDLLRHNDNSRNPYSDCYYVANLIEALKDTLTPTIVARGVISASSLPTEVRTVVEEVAHHMNLDTQLPRYKNVVTVACLGTIRRLQRLGFLPIDPAIFYHYAAPGFYYTVRLAALKALVDFIRGERDQLALDWLFDQLIEHDDDGTDASHPRLRFEAVQLLLRFPPFQRSESGSRLDTPQLVERLWTLMNYGCTSDSRLRCAVADLYYVLYKNRRPTCLPLPEGVLLVRVREGRSVVNFNESHTRGEEIEHHLVDDHADDESSRTRFHSGSAEGEDLVGSDVLSESNAVTSVDRICTVAELFGGEDQPNPQSGTYTESCLFNALKRPVADILDRESPAKRRMQRLSDDEDD